MVDSKKVIGLDDLKNKNLWRALVAEILGTFLFLSMGIGALTTLSVGTIALAFGLGAYGMIIAIGPISGAHMNPAVTIALCTCGHISVMKSLLYIIMQIIGSTLMALYFKLIFPSDLRMNYGVATHSTSSPVAVALEIWAVFIFMILVMVACDSSRESPDAPLLIGLAVAAGIMYCAPLSGAGMNPARAIGPAIVHNYWKGQWVYWVGPITGALLASLTYQLICKKNSKSEDT